MCENLMQILNFFWNISPLPIVTQNRHNTYIYISVISLWCSVHDLKYFQCMKIMQGRPLTLPSHRAEKTRPCCTRGAAEQLHYVKFVRPIPCCRPRV